MLFILLRNAPAIASQFYESIIANKAYVSIGKGLLVTAELTLMGGAAAFAAGALLCTLRMSGIRCVERVFSVVGVLFRGVPVVSLLMILNFCVFTSRDANALLEEVGLLEKANAMPQTLSGGQKQRIAIARCLAMHPTVMLLDEPTSALDPGMTTEVLAIIHKLLKRGLTTVLVTHEMAFAREVSSRVFFIADGVIKESGTPEQIFEHPQTPEAQAFIQRQKQYGFHIESKYYVFMAYLKLSLVALCIVAVSAAFYLLSRKAAFGRWKRWKMQLIYGLSFGALASFATECGVPIDARSLTCATPRRSAPPSSSARRRAFWPAPSAARSVFSRSAGARAPTRARPAPSPRLSPV